MSPRRLQGRRVLLTRPRERAMALTFLLEDEGAEVVSLPMLEILPPTNERPLRAAAEQLTRFEWILFASPSAVEALLDAARQAGTFDLLPKVRLGAVGPATARALSDEGLKVEAEGVGGEGLFGALTSKIKPGDRVLLPIALDGRRELAELLEAAKAEVTSVVAYQAQGAELETDRLSELLSPPVDALIFGSPRTAMAFFNAAGELGKELFRTRSLVAIGPTTAKGISELGGQNIHVAKLPTDEALVEAVVSALQEIR